MAKLLIPLLFIVIGFSAKANGYDSLRLEKKNGIKYIVHKVEPKETLFSISRRYKVKVKDILTHNESVENGLQMYQELFIPYKPILKSSQDSTRKTKNYHIVQPKETLYFISKKYNMSLKEIIKLNQLEDFNIGLGDTLVLSSETLNTAEIETNTIDSLATDSLNYHIVQSSETLYSIALKFNQDIENIRKWNNLISNNLSLGQKLIIRSDTLNSAPLATEIPKVIKPIDTLYVTTDNSRFKTKTESNEGVDKILEEGFASKIDKTEGSRKYLALHRTAPVGTVIEVKNQMTNLSIFARVVGKLPETGLNQKILIRLSHAAFSKLGALDANIPVEIGFVVE